MERSIHNMITNLLFIRELLELKDKDVIREVNRCST